MFTTAQSLRDFRKKTHLTQERLAHLLGTSWVTVSRWERDRAEPQPAAVERLGRLQELVERIGRALPMSELEVFLETPHPRLRNHKPMDLLDNDYAFEDLISLVESAKSGDMM
jgi:transcriptional regulator with XRE-family HTH domain